MNKLLKFKQTDDKKHYWVSDTHYNHNPNWTIPLHETRGYTNAIEMNADIVDKINITVRPNDVLWHLGDIALNCDENQFNDFISKIKCQNIYLLWGNHNNPSAGIYRNEIDNWLSYNDEGYNTEKGGTIYVDEIRPEIYPLRYKNVVFMGDYQEIVVDGQYMVMMHYALNVWNRGMNGAFMVHGHSHGNFKNSLPTELNCGKILDVSWDVFKKPISFNELCNIMKNKKFVAVDHHS